ncbi:MAG: AEC family transporter [Treponema sp.]|nr:AEC family transporter [Treponema sp.]
MFVNLYNVQTFDKKYIDIAFFAFISIAFLMFIGILYAVLFVKDPKKKGVMVQAFYRSNYAIIGIPLATLLFGNGNLAATAIVLAVTIPMYNASSVVFLTIFLKDGKNKISIKSIIYKIFTNPLIDGIIAAGICLLVRPYLGGWTLKTSSFRFIYVTIENLSKITTPLSLIILGAQFKFSATKKLLPYITVGVLARLIFAPLIGLSAALHFYPHFEGPEYAALIPLFGSPIAIASAIMAEQMNNDGELARQILVWTTLFSAITLFIIVAIFRQIGIF